MTQLQVGELNYLAAKGLNIILYALEWYSSPYVK